MTESLLPCPLPRPGLFVAPSAICRHSTIRVTVARWVRETSSYYNASMWNSAPFGCPMLTTFGKQIPRKVLQALRKSNSSDDESSYGGQDIKSITNDALRASVMRSKKLLAMQKALLQQIAEKKKLISVLTDNSIDIVNSLASDLHESTISIKDPSLMNKEQHSFQSNTTKLYEVGGSTEASSNTAKGCADKAKEQSFSNASSAPSYSEYPNSLGTQLGSVEQRNEMNSHLGRASKMYKSTSEERGGGKASLAGNNVMNVLLVAAECAPWIKTGGLGDVAGALPKALAKRGHRVMVVMPRYGSYAESKEIGVPQTYKVAGQDMEVRYFHSFTDGVDFVFLESPIFRNIENDIYGGNRMDILKRMILLCKAAVEVPWHAPCGGVCYGDGNLVFIANDWHTALLPVYLKAYYREKDFMVYARCVLVIHNIAHQGRGPFEDFYSLDLPGHYMDIFKLVDPVGGAHLNILSAGIIAADRLVSVSRGYAWELKTPEGGWGLHGIINDNDWKLHGIVNGIDTSEWNPRLDIHLKSDGYTNYSLETFQSGKAQCKAALQKELGLAVDENVPLIAFIGRLDHQKGVDLIAEAMPWIAGQNVQVVMLVTGRQDLEDTLRRLESQHYDRVRGWVGFSVALAHRMTAGADILLMPSRFEPCGLNQLYAMMYGTVPVVHAVGGLRDTVQQFDPYEEKGLGWVFERAEANRMIDALGHCLNTYRNYKSSWEGLQRRGMMQDLSWDHAAQLYEEVLVAAKYQW